MPKKWLLNRKVEPASEPVTLSDLKSHLRIVPTDSGQDADLNRFISMARDQFELRADHATMLQTWELRLDSLSVTVLLPKPPTVEIVSVTYRDDAGDPVTIPPSAYELVPGGYSPGLLVFNAAYDLPAAGQFLYPYVVTYTCGVADREQLRPGIPGAVLVLAAYFYEHRLTAEQAAKVDLPHAFESIVSQYRPNVP